MAVSSAMKARPFSVAADARQFVKRFMRSEIIDALVYLFVCLDAFKDNHENFPPSTYLGSHWRVYGSE